MGAEKKIAKGPSIWRFLISKVFLLNAFFALVLSLLIVVATLFFIQQYSKHGESKTVPNLIGLTLDEAIVQLNEGELEMIVVDSAYTVDERPHAVLNQEPLPDSKVKSGRTVYLTINMTNPPLTALPSIDIGTSAVSVREILSSHGLKIGETIYKPFEYKDVFLDIMFNNKTIRPGDMIPKGSKVLLVLGNGLGDTKIEIPDMQGLSFAEAVNLLQLKDLSIGTIISQGTINDTANAFVVKQYPNFEPGKMVNLGTMVDIWISNDDQIFDTQQDSI